MDRVSNRAQDIVFDILKLIYKVILREDIILVILAFISVDHVVIRGFQETMMRLYLP